MAGTRTTLFVDTVDPIFERQEVGDDVLLRCRGLPVTSFRRGDSIGRDLAIAALIRLGNLKTDTIAALCETSHGWVCEVRKRVTRGGFQAVVERAPRGPEPKLVGAKMQRLRDLHADGGSVREIGKTLGVSKSIVNSAINRLGLPPRGWRKAQRSLPVATAEVGTARGPTAVGVSAATPSEEAPSERSHPALDGAMASPPVTKSEPEASGDIETTLVALETTAITDEAPASGTELAAGAALESGPMEHPCRYAGTLLLCAAAIALGVFAALDTARVERPTESVYDAPQVFAALMAAWGAGYGSIEAMHERDAGALGVILGLERSPSVRTLHRAIAQMGATFDRVELDAALMRGVLSARLPERLWFGVDIHFKAYAGEAPIDKGWDSKRRLAAKGLADVVVNDEHGYAWIVDPVAAGSGLHQHLLELARTLRRRIGEERPIILSCDRGGFDFDILNALDREHFYYVGYVPASVTLPDLATIAPAQDGVGESAWAHLRLRHATRLLVQRDDTALIPVVTNLPTLIDAVEVVRELRRRRGAQENAFKAARSFAHIDRLVDRGGASYKPDDRLVPNPTRAALKKEQAQGQIRIAALADERPSNSGRARAEIEHDRFWAEFDRHRIKTEMRSAPANVPRVTIEPDAKRAQLKTQHRLLLQPLKFASDNARRWLLGTLGDALAPSHHPDDLEATARTLVALLRAPGTVRFGDELVTVTIELPLPPKPHARLAAVLKALDARSMRFTDGRRLVHFRLAPRPSRELIPGRQAGAR
jgi:hypothetical protein